MLRPDANELERVEADALLDLYTASSRGREVPGMTSERIGTATLLAIPGAPSIVFNRVLGLGVDGPLRPEDLEHITERMGVRASEWYVSLSPHARPAHLYESLLGRGFQEGYRWMKFWRGTDELSSSRATTPLALREVREEEASTFSHVVLRGFDLPSLLAPYLEGIVRRTRWTCYLAWDGDEAVAAGALFVRGRAAWAGMAATLPGHRGRGAQTELIRTAIATARERGTRFIATETGERVPGKPESSYRNILRAGFKEAYLRPNLLAPVSIRTAQAGQSC